jgi:hypothetical protein
MYGSSKYCWCEGTRIIWEGLKQCCSSTGDNCLGVVGNIRPRFMRRPLSRMPCRCQVERSAGGSGGVIGRRRVDTCAFSVAHGSFETRPASRAYWAQSCWRCARDLARRGCCRFESWPAVSEAAPPWMSSWFSLIYSCWSPRSRSRLCETERKCCLKCDDKKVSGSLTIARGCAAVDALEIVTFAENLFVNHRELLARR